MLAKAQAATPWGIEARAVEVEADVQFGLPKFQLVGLPDAAVRESRDRVQAAIRNCGFKLPQHSVVVNLAPANLRKEGNHLDLAIALALLGAHERLAPAVLERRLFCGELGLDGTVRTIRGGLAIATLAQQLAVDEVLLPAANAPEAASLGRGRVIPVTSLNDAIEHVLGSRTIAPQSPTSGLPPRAEPAVDLAQIKGQEAAKRALEIAAAGGHNLLLVGPPGTGKTLLARALPGILPPLARDEAITVTKIQSVALDRPPECLVHSRPFRAPHASVSTAGMVGGGSIPRPGEVTLAHAGVLFLDELPEFRRDTLEALRQPVEDGTVAVVRARARLEFPARFSLVAAMNPCPCGYHGDERQDCRCPPGRREAYQGRISGPLLDRIDLRVEVPSLELPQLQAPGGEPSRRVGERIASARKRQQARSSRANTETNGNLEGRSVERLCSPDGEGQRLLERAYERLRLTPRSVHRILRVARTLADLEAADEVGAPHVGEAIQYRGATHLGE